MAFTFSTNTIPASNAACLYLLITTLVAAGWTKTKDSDGTTFSSTGVQVTGAGSGAHGLNNNGAWFVLRDPNTKRAFCFQRNQASNTFQWRVKYSPINGFVAGAPAAQVTPSATDEVIIIGGGTDAAPTFTQFLSTVDGTMRMNICAGDASVGYAFWWDTFTAGNVNASNHWGMLLEVMAPGSFPAADTDPAAIYIFAANNALNGTTPGTTTPFGGDLYVTNTRCGAFFGNTHTAAADYRQLSPSVYGDRSLNTFQVPAGVGVVIPANPFTALDDVLPVMWARSSTVPGGAPYGYKGFGSLMKWACNGRANYDTLSVAAPGTRENIYLNGAVLPWDSSVPVL